MTRLRSYVLVLVVGAALAWFVTLLMGWLAAIAIPRAFFVALKGHDILTFVLHTTLLVQFPVAVVSFIVGLLLFRSLHAPSLILVAICASPWLAFNAIWYANYYATADFAPLVKLGFLFNWQSLPGLLGLPLALWLAWTLRLPPGSNLLVQPTASAEADLRH
jgi:hypothetical protein